MILDDPLLQHNLDGTQSSVLKNKGGYTTQAELDQAELLVVSAFRVPEVQRQVETRIASGEFGKNGSFQELSAIHKHLFQDLYEWAGTTREVNIAKREAGTKNVTQFEYIAPLGDDPRKLTDEKRAAAREVFAEKFAQLDRDMAAKGPVTSRQAFAQRMTETFARLNQLHPFREGNGRAIREYLGAEAQRHGYKLDLAPISREDWLAASVQAARGNSQPMEVVMYRSAVLKDAQHATATATGAAPSPERASGGFNAAAQDASPVGKLQRWLKNTHGVELEPHQAAHALNAARGGRAVEFEVDTGLRRGSRSFTLEPEVLTRAAGELHLLNNASTSSGTKAAAPSAAREGLSR